MIRLLIIVCLLFGIVQSGFSEYISFVGKDGIKYLINGNLIERVEIVYDKQGNIEYIIYISINHYTRVFDKKVLNEKTLKKLDNYYKNAGVLNLSGE